MSRENNKHLQIRISEDLLDLFTEAVGKDNKSSVIKCFISLFLDWINEENASVEKFLNRSVHLKKTNTVSKFMLWMNENNDPLSSFLRGESSIERGGALRDNHIIDVIDVLEEAKENKNKKSTNPFL